MRNGILYECTYRIRLKRASKSILMCLSLAVYSVICLEFSENRECECWLMIESFLLRLDSRSTLRKCVARSEE